MGRFQRRGRLSQSLGRSLRGELDATTCDAKRRTQEFQRARSRGSEFRPVRRPVGSVFKVPAFHYRE